MVTKIDAMRLWWHLNLEVSTRTNSMSVLCNLRRGRNPMGRTSDRNCIAEVFYSVRFEERKETRTCTNGAVSDNCAPPLWGDGSIV